MGCGAIVSIRAADAIVAKRNLEERQTPGPWMHLTNLRKKAALRRHRCTFGIGRMPPRHACESVLWIPAASNRPLRPLAYTPQEP
jgi:hypothetical protein